MYQFKNPIEKFHTLKQNLTNDTNLWKLTPRENPSISREESKMDRRS